jgi:hypothetical protein
MGDQPLAQTEQVNWGAGEQGRSKTTNKPFLEEGDNPDRWLYRVVGHGKLDWFWDTGYVMLNFVQHIMTSIQHPV